VGTAARWAAQGGNTMQTAIKEIKTDRSQYQILFTPDGFEPDFPAAPEGEAEAEKYRAEPWASV